MLKRANSYAPSTIRRCTTRGTTDGVAPPLDDSASTGVLPLGALDGARHGGAKFVLQFTCDADKSICEQADESERRSTKVITKHAYENGKSIVPLRLLIETDPPPGTTNKPHTVLPHDEYTAPLYITALGLPSQVLFW